MSTELQVIKSLLPALSKPVVKSKKKSLLTGAGIGLGTLGALGGASVLSDHYSRKKLVNNAKDIIALSGAGAGGLGGLGLATLLTDNAWLKALGALGGGVAGGLAGKYLAGKYASENTHVPENTYTPENTHVPENNYGIIPVTVENMAASISPYAGDNYERKITNAEEMENKIKNELDINNIKADLARKARIRSILYGAGGATLGGLGGLGLTSLVTKNKLLRALGALGGGVAGGLGGKYLSGKYASTDKKYTKSSYNNPDYIIEKQKENAKALKEKLNNYVLTYGSNPQGIQYLNELNKKNKELELDYKLLNADYQKVNNKYHELNQLFNLSRALNRATLGAGVGGLGGYGLTSLMTKNKWLRALGALGGGVVGGAVGYNPVYWRNKTRDLWYDTKSYADKAINKFKNKK